MKAPPSKHETNVRPSDLRGLARLATDATLGVTGIVENMHQAVMRSLGLGGKSDSERTSGLTGLVYQVIRGVMNGVGNGVDGALRLVEPLTTDTDSGELQDSPARLAVLSALNGVIGDRLRQADSPFAIEMSIRAHRTCPPSTTHSQGAGNKVLLLAHGLCMNDLQWQMTEGATTTDLGTKLAETLGYSPLYLRYNSGLNIADNGQQLADHLERQCATWPTAITDLTLLGHSMGGLLLRSAMHQATEMGMRWPSLVKHMVFLGTPHHGAPLERAGHWVDQILTATPYTAPFAKLGKLRSPGITDLRHGHIANETVPLPKTARCFAIAATTDMRLSTTGRSGDGLVSVDSALGQHTDPAACLAFPAAHRWIAEDTNHLGLLRSEAVASKLIAWLD